MRSAAQPTPGRRGAWEVEHSVPRANGGTNHGNNLYGAHINCNRRKGTVTSRTARGWHGRTRAPLSASARERKVTENTITGGVCGGLFGLLAGNPPLALTLAVVGSVVGANVDPDE